MNDEPATARQEPRSGTIVAGRYRVERLLARGGMATVYLARQLGLDRLVALKLMTPPPDGDDVAQFGERFRLEASTLASLDHPHIVVLHDYGTTDDGVAFLAMEFVDGPRLTDLVKDGPLPVDRALALITQVCNGLRYAHRKGVIHRDLKPSNLLVKHDDSGDHVKIVDFGLVKLAESDQSITRTGLVLGSPHCMSPEQVQGRPVDPRTDQYAIGVLLFRCIAGAYPFHGANGSATMMAHLHDPVPSLAAAAPEVALPQGLESVVTRCLQKDPAARFADLSELLVALSAVSGIPTDAGRTATHSTVAARTTRPAPTTRTGPALLFAAVAIVVVVVLGLGVAAALSFPRPEPARPPPVEVQRPDLPEPAPPPAPEPAPVVATPPVPEAEPPPARPPAQPPRKAPVPATPEGYLGLPDDLQAP